MLSILAHLHKFENSVKVEMRMLYSQPFTISHLHFLIIVECDKMVETRLCAGEYAEMKKKSVNSVQ